MFSRTLNYFTNAVGENEGACVINFIKEIYSVLEFLIRLSAKAADEIRAECHISPAYVAHSFHKIQVSFSSVIPSHQLENPVTARLGWKMK